MRFPLFIPPLLLLILNWCSLDSDAVDFHNGSFVAVKSLDHIQFTNTSSIDGNFATRNTRLFRKSSTHDVKSLFDNNDNSEDTVSSQFTPNHQDSRGKRQKRDSQEDELAQAEKNVTDLMSEISKISQELKEKEDEAKTTNEKYENAKAAVKEKEKVAADWEEAQRALLNWKSSEKALKRANASFDEATNNLKVANETLEAAEEELKRVEGEPKLLENKTNEFKLLDAEHTELKTAITNWEDDLPPLQQAYTTAKNKVSEAEAELSREGCKANELTGPCETLRQVLNRRIDARNVAQQEYEAAVTDIKAKTEKLAECEPEWTRLKKEISELRRNVAKHDSQMTGANITVETAKKEQTPLLEIFNNALKARDDASEKEQSAKQSYDDKASKVPADAGEVGNAFAAAQNKFDMANERKEIVDKDVNTLKTRLEEMNAELAQANAKVEALKQNSKKDEPKTGALMYIGIGAGCGILLIVFIIGGILFTVKRRKSKVKEEPSPTINPDALKYEKVPALDKSKQESTTTQSNSTQRATPAKSDTNVAATQLSSSKGSTPAKSDTNVAATQLSSSKGATPATSDTNLEGGHALKRDHKYQPATPTERDPKYVYKGPKHFIPDNPDGMSAPPLEHEKLSEEDFKLIQPRLPLITELAKPNSSSSKPGGCQLPADCTQLKWAKIKAFAMQVGDEKVEPLPDDVLHAVQDAEDVEENDDTLYERSTKNEKRTGATLLDEYKNDKLTADEALKLNKTCLIALYRKLHFPFGILMQKLAAVREIFKSQTVLAQCGVPAVVYGDIHGQSSDLIRLMTLGAYDPEIPHSTVLDMNKERFVFCGDYVDRGKRSLEVLTNLFTMKIAYPYNVYLVRGNHETREVNKKYGFWDDIEKRYEDDDQATKLYDAYNEVFDYMPMACVIGGMVMCTHGGISRHLNSIDDIKKIPQPLRELAKSSIALDVAWSDPANKLAGYKPNDKRGISEYFGEDVLKALMLKLGMIMWLTGHRIPANGYALFGMLRIFCTLFTAMNVSKGKKNFGTCVKIFANGEMQFRSIHKCPNCVFFKMLVELNNERNDDYANHNDEGEPGLYDMDQTTCAANGIPI